ncbi:MAG: hypothetical protein FWG52_01445 [Proteobacteria bacterium]|nr:hypothetical protein [Pseudomonadota bacterium]
MNDIQKTTKISTKIDRRILREFEEKLEAACLRRDAFLNRVLEDELPHLDEEVAENSSEAQQFIANRLDQLVRKQVSLALRSDLVERLNDICERKRIVRDAFFNRLFFLLAASSEEIDRLFFDGEGEWRWDVEHHADGPRARERLRDHIAPVKEPFWAIRAGLSLREEDAKESGEQLPGGIYSAVWGNPLNKKAAIFALNCYLPNEKIPDHPDQLALLKRAEDFLASLMND